MLIDAARLGAPTPEVPLQRLWHDASRLTPSLGCAKCPDRWICGRLSVAAPIFDCMHLCCSNPGDCDSVCRNKPEDFARRVREIGGFDLDSVPRAPKLVAPELPDIIPTVFHGGKRESQFEGPGAVCIPLFKVIGVRGAEVKFHSDEDLRKKFKLSPDTTIILTGTSTDAALEKWWSLGDRRSATISALKKLRISLVTTPNYSLFADQPRWDDLHSMKRIALVCQEFLNLGVPCALHVNARTERDWERWAEFLAARTECTHIAFEFGTGAGWKGRIDWYADQLTRLRTVIARPIHLIVRGGISILPRLANTFDGVTLLETSTFVKTVRRKAAFLDRSSRLRWRHAPTQPNEMLDTLFEHNWTVVSERLAKSRIVARKAA